ncbi:LOW QUALITY PROTEIN: hypothetical protein BC938DRAFT_470846 [Jimgerdemannia flammicorona]|uniref:Dethiobiotin synthase n=1 Tax=Jimgerdemannia flammicorona TaxID=994334 RepID=A0A433R060_9FUNG|nr:LOW QUALITY PROTEIN: hypothetical protein BC938DRAFT_470846 [Jimgerdemannia flammicorona]
MLPLYHPTRALQLYHIFAANTNVGKTIFATGLCRAAAIVAEKNKKKVFYLKPVQTGYPTDSDASSGALRRIGDLFSSSNAFSYRTDNSCYPIDMSEIILSLPYPLKQSTSILIHPHIATEKPPPDDEVLNVIKTHISEFAASVKKTPGGVLFLETAGGVHSPIMSGMLT